MKSKEKKKNCYSCAYRIQVVGSAHSRCTFAWDNTYKIPKANKHGIEKGWYNFPFNYDPVWQEEICESHSTEKDPNKIAKSNPLIELISLLG